jgi:UDP-N-acetylmuramoylalanine--D-glutamate ligase
VSRVLVVGLARSGRAAAELLVREGHEVVAVDSGPIDWPGHPDLDLRAPWTDPVDGVTLVVKSPGVPAAAAPVAAARSTGVPVISEVELAAQRLANPLIGVTGTNGKTTTTELTAHLLRSAGIAAEACGNQGTPLSGRVGAVAPDVWLVVECSSFQLEDIDTFHPRAAVLLNITPDHLDRHGSMDAYLAAKLRIFENQAGSDLSIVPRELGERTPRPAFIDDSPGNGSVAWAEGGLHHRDLGCIAGWDAVALRGRHNRQNAMAAVALAAHAGAGRDALAAGLTSFPGVPHRLEVVATIAGVTFVNDSKATNPDATVAALDAYPAGVHLILGGQGKGTSFDPVARACGGVVRAYLIGEAAPQLAAALAVAGVPHEISGAMDAAVDAAATRARPGEVILLAPACTSLDQYANFEERGADFRRAVAARPSD